MAIWLMWLKALAPDAPLDRDRIKIRDVTITLNLRPEIEAGLLAEAQAAGMTLEGYLQHLVERELSTRQADQQSSEGSGMVWENGLFVYRTGRPLPTGVLDDAIRRSREERAQHILGELS